jgi:hypothetical protein
VRALEREEWWVMIEDADVDIEATINAATEVYKEYDQTLPLSPYEDDPDTGHYPKAA